MSVARRDVTKMRVPLLRAKREDTNMKKLMIAVALAAAVSALTSGQQAFSEDYQQAILTHHPVVVTFDNCNGNIGTIKCGEQYFLQYPGAPGTTPKGNMCKSNCGVNALKNPPPPYQDSGGYCNANPETVTDIGRGTTWSIDVFGRILYYNNNGEVFDQDSHDLIGHMSIAQRPSQPLGQGSIIERCINAMCARPTENCVF